MHMISYENGDINLEEDNYPTTDGWNGVTLEGGSWVRRTAFLVFVD